MVTATAAIADAQGRTIGDARLQQTPNGLLLKLDLRSAPPGTHAVHIHEVGRCEPPTFESAGDHFAGGAQDHGFLQKQGPHAGDLPNLEVPPTGQLSVEYLVEALALTSGRTPLLDGDGAAIVIHADEDDYRSAPSGNAGDRIACGAIRR
jgi:Cu-Zn family superoxide dismutase